AAPVPKAAHGSWRHSPGLCALASFAMRDCVWPASALLDPAAFFPKRIRVIPWPAAIGFLSKLPKNFLSIQSASAFGYSPVAALKHRAQVKKYATGARLRAGSTTPAK